MKESNIMTLAELPAPDTTEIERQVLFDAVSSSEILPDIIPLVNRTYFSEESRRKVWDAIVDNFNKGVNVDFVTIHSRVGKEFVEEVLSPKHQESTPTIGYRHAQLLRTAYIRRTCYFASLQLLSECANKYMEEEDIYSSIQKLTTTVQDNNTINRDKTISNIINEIADDIQQRAEMVKQGIAFRVPTGFESLDWYTYKGWGPGQLIILAARPSVGKTAIMLKMAKTAARAGFPTIVFSLEMTNEELGQRLLFSTGYVRPIEIANCEVDWGLYDNAAQQFNGIPLRVNDKSKYLSDICSRIIINAQQGKCKVAFIDYLGLIVNENKGLSLPQSIGEITSTLKNTAKQAGIPIVLLCQLNRLMAKEGRAPELFDLRDSGSIEQDADIVLMLEQKMSDIPNNEGPIGDSNPDINMWIRKNRQNKKEICITLRPNETYSDFMEIGSH